MNGMILLHVKLGLGANLKRIAVMLPLLAAIRAGASAIETYSCDALGHLVNSGCAGELRFLAGNLTLVS
jgi:hypothetical protein